MSDSTRRMWTAAQWFALEAIEGSKFDNLDSEVDEQVRRASNMDREIDRSDVRLYLYQAAIDYTGLAEDDRSDRYLTRSYSYIAQNDMREEVRGL